MTLSPPTLAALPALVTLAVAAGRLVVPLAREARLIAVVWLACAAPNRVSAEIIRAFTGGPQQGLANGDPAKQHQAYPDYQTRQPRYQRTRSRVAAFHARAPAEAAAGRRASLRAGIPAMYNRPDQVAARLAGLPRAATDARAGWQPVIYGEHPYQRTA
jgi:hypothetical protein